MSNDKLQDMILSVLELLQKYSLKCEEYPEDIRPETLEDHDYGEDKIVDGLSYDLQRVMDKIGADNFRSLLEMIAESHEYIWTIINRGVRDLIEELELEDIYRKYNRF